MEDDAFIDIGGNVKISKSSMRVERTTIHKTGNDVDHPDHYNAHPSGARKKWSERNVSPKLCRRCNSKFQPSTGGNLYCASCVPEQRREKHANGQRAWRQKNPTRHAVNKANFDLKRFGLTFEDYQKMLVIQGGACAICKTMEPRGRGKTRKFAVDHDHINGKVRALLCHRCNGALGMVNDSIEVLNTMIRYLEEHGCPTIP